MVYLGQFVPRNELGRDKVTMLAEIVAILPLRLISKR